ncbi:MAG: hypothetical protein AB7F75_09540 [Planctomycetota bacterium]
MRLLLLTVLLLTAGCRILPPLPSMDEPGGDERMFSKLASLDWSKVDLGVSFDGTTVQTVLGDDVVPRESWDILTPGDYARRFPKESSGIRRLFKFYVMETTASRGLSVFVHEAVHGFNWIDILDMEYNEFLSIAGELRLAESMASTAPDLALNVVVDALSLRLPRDEGYREQQHMRARLWLCALLVDQSPTEIYRWARDCTKREFAKAIRQAIGNDPRDLKREGSLAFCRRLLGAAGASYLEVLMDTRDEPNPRLRKACYEELLAQTPKESPFYDNLEYQILVCQLEMGHHEEVLSKAERLWPSWSHEHLASPVSILAYEAACALHHAQGRDLWHRRGVSLQVWRQQLWLNEMARVESRCRHGLQRLNSIMDFASQIRSSDFCRELPQVSDDAEALLARCLSLELQPRRSIRLDEDTLTRALVESIRLRDPLLEGLARSRLGERAFLDGDLEGVLEAYGPSPEAGTHDMEVKFWLEQHP